MKCPYCGSEETRVTDSRPVEESNSIRRRRQCDSCGKRFTTYEKIETIPLVVIKKDHTRQQYDRAKIEAGVMRACYKRPIPVDEIKKMIDRVETELYNQGGGVAYVRFASVYREFKDVGTFMDELKKIIN